MVLSAGVFGHPYQLTEDSLEYIIQVNYVSNFYLMRQLFKSQAFNPDASITIVSSESHRFAPISCLDSIDVLNFSPLPSQFYSVDQYNLSKLYCILLAQCLHTEYTKYGIKCTAVHPGKK